MRDRFSFGFPATETAARSVIRSVVLRLGDAGLDSDRAGEIEVALAEAVNNVVEHACAGSPDAVIRLLGSLRQGRLDIRILDTGAPMPEARLPQGLAANVDVPRQDLPEGGFGWFLIRSLTTDLRYDRCGECNHLSLRFDL